MPQAPDDVFDRVIRRGARVNRPGLTLYSLKLLHPPRPRIVISQKIDKRATARNRLRRQLRAVIRQYPVANRALMVIVRKELADRTYAELKQILGGALSSIL